MTEVKRLIIGTRGSRLALAQTELVTEALRRAHPGLIIEDKIITTKGDVNQSPIPLDTVGKAWFTEEIEEALLKGEIDLAVHSLKDLPPNLPAGLMIMSVLPRADVADVLVSKSGALLKDLKIGAVVGTDSIRRKALLLDARPDLIVKSIRGNVDTRLKKLQTEDYDAIVIAAAGLTRLCIADRATERLDPTAFIPAPGQGIMAAEAKQDRPEVMEMLHGIVHKPTELAAEIEQAFSNAIGGGCKLPIGCYAEIKEDAVTVHAVVGNTDGSHVVRKSKSSPIADGKKIAEELAAEFLKDTISKDR